MKRVILATILATGILSAADFTTMSTEDLVALRGTVATEDRDAFRDELQSRVSALNIEEKSALGIEPKGYGDMTGTAPQDGTGFGNTGESTGGGFGSGSGGGFGGGSGGGHGKGGGRRQLQIINIVIIKLC